MTAVAVLVPVLARPERVGPVTRSILASDPRAHPLFLCSPGDEDEIAACSRAAWTIIVGWDAGGGDYARKMNLGYQVARDLGYEWVFLGADDLHFHPSWFDACLRAHERSGVCVVGTNDMGNSRVISGRHSTHTLVHRDYIDCGGTVDDPARLLHEGYDHQFVDDEFVQTAQARGTYVHAVDAYVEHLHPNWGKGRDDETYRKGSARFDADRALYAERSSMWLPGPALAVSFRGDRRRG